MALLQGPGITEPGAQSLVPVETQLVSPVKWGCPRFNAPQPCRETQATNTKSPLPSARSCPSLKVATTKSSCGSGASLPLRALRPSSWMHPAPRELPPQQPWGMRLMLPCSRVVEDLALEVPLFLWPQKSLLPQRTRAGFLSTTAPATSLLKPTGREPVTQALLWGRSPASQLWPFLHLQVSFRGLVLQ